MIVFLLSFIAVIYFLIFAPARYFTWHALIKSPEPVAEIIYTEVDTVTVRTTSNKKFSCKIYNEKECWIEVYYEPFKGIPLWCFPDDYSTKHTVQIAAACNLSHSFGIIGTIYALHDDGIIYAIHKGLVFLPGYMMGAILGGFGAFSAFIGKHLFVGIISLFQRNQVN